MTRQWHEAYYRTPPSLMHDGTEVSAAEIAPRRTPPVPSMRISILLPILIVAGAKAEAQSPLAAELAPRVAAVNPHVVAWRRDIHEHPELSGEEERTSQLVAAELRKLGLEVRTGVGGHGVVGVLRGGKPGPVVALRADMDALPVVEEVDLPFKSKVRTTFNGQEVGVMHACGHDAHVAMLLGTAEVLAGMKPRIAGTVKFLFQPAEESLGGAAGMIRDGALTDPAPSAVFGVHVFPYRTGTVVYHPGGFMAAGGTLRIVVHGRQTHGAQPWNGVDPIVTASQIVLGLQTIVSRQLDLTASPAIVTIGTINGGVRVNIIPDSVVMTGTVRTFDPAQVAQLPGLIRRTAEQIATSAGATASVSLEWGAPVTYNDPALLERMRPTVERAVGGAAKVLSGPPSTTSEDFSLFQQKVPGVFIFLGVTPEGTDPATAAPNHSPRFFVDEAAFPTGVRLLSSLALDYLDTRGVAP